MKTADTGYMSRRLIKALEDLSIHYDNTVRNASGCIVQFLYGDDCMDPAQMEGKSGFPLNFNRLFMKAKVMKLCPSFALSKNLFSSLDGRMDLFIYVQTSTFICRQHVGLESISIYLLRKCLH